MAELNLREQSEIMKSLPANETLVQGNLIIDSKGTTLLSLGSDKEASLVNMLIQQFHINHNRIDRAVGMLKSGDDRITIDELMDDLISSVAQNIGACRGLSDCHKSLLEINERTSKCVEALDAVLK